MALETLLIEADDKMDKAVEYLQGELAGLRTGRASPGLVDQITVDYYGTATRLQDLANIAIPEPRLIVINPYDPSALPAMEKAIQVANLGVTPMNDGRVIRIPIPELTEERRQELTKVAHRVAEEQRVAVRNIRRDTNDSIKSLQKQGEISEDERDDALETVQESTDKATKKIDELLAAKGKEVLEE